MCIFTYITHIKIILIITLFFKTIWPTLLLRPPILKSTQQPRSNVKANPDMGFLFLFLCFVSKICYTLSALPRLFVLGSAIN